MKTILLDGYEIKTIDMNKAKWERKVLYAHIIIGLILLSQFIISFAKYYYYAHR